MTLFSSVFKSVFSRRDVKIFLAFSMIPILVPSLASLMETVEMGAITSVLEFYKTVMQMQFSLALPVIILSLITTSVFKDEIDSGIMFLYKDISRKAIFKAKLFSLYSLVALFYLVNMLTTVLACLALNTGQAIDFISNANLLLPTLLDLSITFLLFLITINLVALWSMKMKAMTAILLGVFFSIFANTAPLLTAFRYFFPNSYPRLVGEMGLALASLLAIIVALLYLLPTYYKALATFKKVEF